MSEDNKDPELQTWIDPELEARVVAWVLGEASEFEAAELARIVAEKPELGIFKRRIEAVHGLVAAASGVETMRLDADRRRKLLERLGAKEGAPVGVVAMPQEQTKEGWRFSWNTAVGIAACLVVAALLASLALPAYTSVQSKALAARKLAAERNLVWAKAVAEADKAPAEVIALEPAPTPAVTPAEPPRLAALDSLKAFGRRSSEEEDGAAIEPAPPPAGAAKEAVGSGYALAGGRMELPASRNLSADASGGAAAAPAMPAPPLPTAMGQLLQQRSVTEIDEYTQNKKLESAEQQRATPPAQEEVSATDQPYSTFSLHVSDVSFLLAKDALARGEMPDRDSIRPEEFYNAFDYGDPAPAPGEKIACRIEQAAHPVLQQRNLVRIAMKVAATGRGQGQPLRLTVLLDTSGSMEREDRAASVRKALEVLTSLLGPQDAVTLIGFARQPRLLAEEVPGDQAGKLADIAAHTPSEGGTNMEEAIKTASELALRHFKAGGQNRVVMLTDGAANLGDADPAQLGKLVEQLRQKGVSFDACGVGADGLNDDILEALTRKGGGRYYFLNKPEDADEGFARQLAGAFRPAAENVKMQVRFNPSRVGKYRLIGFEKHRLNQEDFRNDKVTAAQLAAEEAAVALYQVQVLPEGEGELGEVFVRFRDPADGRMVEQSWTIPYDPHAPALDKAAPSMQLAATASLLAEKLRGGAAADVVDLDAIEPLVAQLRGHYGEQARVQDLVTMFEEARRMTPRK